MVHIHKHSIPIDNVINEIIGLNPVGILIWSGSELNVYDIYDSIIDGTENWRIQNNKNIYVFGPALQTDLPITKFPNVLFFESHLYDINLVHTIGEYFNSPAFCVLKNPIKLFTCYNNRPSPHRTYLIDQLAKYYLLDHNIVTYKAFCEIHPVDRWSYYNGTPALIDEEDYVCGSKPEYIPNAFPKSYFDGLIDVVTESRYLPNELYMSEKTAKPLMALKPFIVLGPPEYHQWLREHKKIEMYDEIFDYSFDTEPDYKKRANGIVHNLIALKNRDYDEILQLVKPKLKHNLISYVKHVFTGETVFKNIPFDWIYKEETMLNHLCRGVDDLLGDLNKVLTLAEYPNKDRIIHELLNHLD